MAKKQVTPIIREMAFPGINAFIAENIEASIPKKSKILILASGEGSLDQVLLAKGYTNIHSVDYFTNYKLAGKIPHIKCDLNSPTFAQDIKKKFGGSFDLITGLEIIEHVFSSHNFLKNISELLSDKGTAVISTPNTHAFIARVDYLLTGYPTFYIDQPKIGDHVNPIFNNIFEHLAAQTGLKIKQKQYYGSPWTYLKIYDKRTIKSKFYIALLATLYVLLQPLMLINREQSKTINKIFWLQRKA